MSLHEYKCIPLSHFPKCFLFKVRKGRKLTLLDADCAPRAILDALHSDLNIGFFNPVLTTLFQCLKSLNLQNSIFRAEGMKKDRENQPRGSQ